MCVHLKWWYQIRRIVCHLFLGKLPASSLYCLSNEGSAGTFWLFSLANLTSILPCFPVSLSAAQAETAAHRAAAGAAAVAAVGAATLCLCCPTTHREGQIGGTEQRVVAAGAMTEGVIQQVEAAAAAAAAAAVAVAAAAVAVASLIAAAAAAKCVGRIADVVATT